MCAVIARAGDALVPRVTSAYLAGPVLEAEAKGGSNRTHAAMVSASEGSVGKARTAKRKAPYSM